MVHYLDFSERFSQIDKSKIKITDLQRFAEIKSIQDQITDYFKCPHKEIDTYLFASTDKFGITETHGDGEGVFLLSTFGKVVYNIYYTVDNFKSILMEKGDMLYIPPHMYHSAMPLGPRVIISIGVERKPNDK